MRNARDSCFYTLSSTLALSLVHLTNTFHLIFSITCSFFFLTNSITALENKRHLIVFYFFFLLEPQTFWRLAKLALSKLCCKFTAATPTIFLYKVICPFIIKKKIHWLFLQFLNYQKVDICVYLQIHQEKKSVVRHWSFL